MKNNPITPSNLTRRLMFNLIGEVRELSNSAVSRCWETVTSEMRIEKRKMDAANDVTIVLAFVPSVRGSHHGLAVRLVQKRDKSYKATHLFDPEKGGHVIPLWHRLEPDSPLMVALADELAKSIYDDEHGNQARFQTPWQIHSSPTQQVDCRRMVDRLQADHNQKLYTVEMEYQEKHLDNLPPSTKPVEPPSHRPTTFTIGNSTSSSPGVLVPMKPTDPVLVLERSLIYPLEPNRVGDDRMIVPIEVHSHGDIIEAKRIKPKNLAFETLLTSCPKRLGDDLETILGFNPARNGDKDIDIYVCDGLSTPSHPMLIIRNKKHSQDEGSIAFTVDLFSNKYPVTITRVDGIPGADAYPQFQALYGLDVTNVVGATAWFKEISKEVTKLVTENL